MVMDFCSPQVTGRDILRLFRSGKNLSTFSRDACTVKKFVIWTPLTIIIRMWRNKILQKTNPRPEQSLRCVSSKDVKIVLKLLKSILLIFWLRHYDIMTYAFKKLLTNPTRMCCAKLVMSSYHVTPSPYSPPKSLG